MDKIRKLKKELFQSNFPEQVDSATITSMHNRRYFTNFSSSRGYLFVTKETSYLLVDFRYIEAAKNQSKNCEVILFDKIEETLQSLIKRHNIKSTILESDSITLSNANNLKEIFEKNNTIVYTNKNLDKIINKIRMIKIPDEINKIKIAQKITEDSFYHILKKIKPGITEKEIALELEFYMRKLGAERVAFDLIVVSGKNGSLPHGIPSDKPVQKGDLVTLDIGAVYEGYYSDMTRTIAISSVNDEQKNIYDIVLNAQVTAIKSIKPGVICSRIDKIARDIIYSSGYKGYFEHSTGHGVGMEIHEKPVFSSNCKTALKSGMVITVEPGIYIPNKFGVRIEDMILVTKAGFENLTTVDKQLMVL